MILGGVLAASSFILCMFLQLAVEAQDSNALTLINTVPCKLNVTYNLDGAIHNFKMAQNGDFLEIKRPFPEFINFDPLCEGKMNLSPMKYPPSPSHREPREKLITFAGSDLRVIPVSLV